MKLRDLPPWLQELAKQRTIEDNGNYRDDGDLSGLFIFNKTPEGFHYWKDINNGIIPPNPNQQMARQEITVRDAERMVSIEHFKYSKATRTFTIKQKDLLPLVRPMNGGESIPKRIIIVNDLTGRREAFNIDILHSESITIPRSVGNTYPIRYYPIGEANGFIQYMLEVVVDVQQ